MTTIVPQARPNDPIQLADQDEERVDEAKGLLLHEEERVWGSKVYNRSVICVCVFNYVSGDGRIQRRSGVTYYSCYNNYSERYLSWSLPSTVYFPSGYWFSFMGSPLAARFEQAGFRNEITPLLSA